MIRSQLVMPPSSSSTCNKRKRSSSSPVLSSSTIAADKARACHLLKIDGYSSTSRAYPNGRCICSHPFKVGGYSWHLRYYPNGCDKTSSGHVSLFLALDQEVARPVQVQYNLRLVDADDAADDEAISSPPPPPPPPPPPLESTARFKSHESYGEARFLKKEDLEGPTSCKHLRHDAFTVQCDMVVIEIVAHEVVTPPAAAAAVPPSNLQEHLGELLRSEHGADVVFQVGGETLAAHRWLLAVRSPVFNAELCGAMKESSTGVVRVDDMEPEVFRALLCFIYTDALPETMDSHGEEEYVMSQHLLVASDKYNLERLKFMCQEKLCRHIVASNVTFVLELAERHQCSGLKNACFEYLSTPAHLEAALATESFKHMSRNCPSLMMELLAKLGTQTQ